MPFYAAGFKNCVKIKYNFMEKTIFCLYYCLYTYIKN